MSLRQAGARYVDSAVNAAADARACPPAGLHALHPKRREENCTAPARGVAHTA